MLAAWRSLLYVPANVRRFIEKSPSSGADAIILDLEDSVPPQEKDSARRNLAAAVATCGAGGADVLVRINRSLHMAVRDIEAALEAGSCTILVPKILGPEHVRLLAELGEAAGLDSTDTPALRLIPMIETAEAACNLNAIAAASRSVVGIIVGTEDLAAQTLSDTDNELMSMIKHQAILAAAAAGIAPFGLLGSIADYKDLQRIRDLAVRSRRSGFLGATCIHPSIVPVLNDAFTPSEQEIETAKRQIAAAQAAASAGRGSFAVEGRMVDAAVLRRARRILDISKRAH